MPHQDDNQGGGLPSAPQIGSRPQGRPEGPPQISRPSLEGGRVRPPRILNPEAIPNPEDYDLEEALRIRMKEHVETVNPDNIPDPEDYDLGERLFERIDRRKPGDFLGVLKELGKGLGVAAVELAFGGPYNPAARGQARRALTQHGFLDSPGEVTLLDAAGQQIVSAAFEEFGGIFERGVPFVGPKIVKPFLDPLQKEANQTAMETTARYFSSVEDPFILNNLQDLIGGSRMLGGLTGAGLGLYAYFRLGGVALRGMGLGRSIVVNDSILGGIYSGSSGEGGILHHFAGRGDSAKTHEQDALSLWQRLEAAAWGAGEFALLGGAIRQLMATRQTAKMRQTLLNTVKTRAEFDEILAASGAKINADGSISVGLIRQEELARQIARSETMLEFIDTNPAAQSIVESGGSTFEAFAAAIKESRVHGGVSSMSNVIDPAELVSEARKVFATRVDLANRAVKGEILASDFRAPLAHSTKGYERVITSNKDVPTFLTYASGEGAVIRGVPLSADPAAAVRGFHFVQEAIVQPSSREAILRVKSWHDLPELAEAIGQLRKKGIEVVVVQKGLGRGQDILPIVDDVVKSVKRVPGEGLQAAIARDLSALEREGAISGEVIGRELEVLKEPSSVRLARRFNDMTFQRFKNPDGTYNILMWDKNYKMPKESLKQFKREGLYTGQHVRWKEGEYIFEKVQPGRKGEQFEKWAFIRPVDGGPAIRVPKQHINPMFEGVPLTKELEESFLPFFTNKFQSFLEEEMAQIASRGVYRMGLKDIAQSLERPIIARRDIPIKHASTVTYPDGVPGASESLLSSEEKLTRMFKEGEGEFHVLPPYSAANEADFLWGRFLKENADILPELSAAERNVLKQATFQKLRERIMHQIPKLDRQVWRRIQKELQREVEALPSTLENEAGIRGFVVHRTAEGPMLQKVNTKTLYGFGDDETAKAFLQETRPVEADLLPGQELYRVNMPGGVHPSGGLDIDGYGIIDYMEAKADDLVKAYSKGLPTDSMWGHIIGGRRLFTLLQEKTGLPLFDKFFEPMIKAQRISRNNAAPFLDSVVKAWKGIRRRRRIKIGEFMHQLDDEATLLNEGEIFSRARDFGLNDKEIKAILQSRLIFNQMYKLGLEAGMFKGPNVDYLFNYYSRIRPITQQRGVTPDQLFDLAPNTVDSFVHKYIRNGMLSAVEADPLLVMKRYVSSFFFERDVGAVYGAAARMRDIKWGDLPKGVQENVRSLLPAGFKPKDHHTISKILPDIGRPMESFLETVRGFPKESSDIGTKFVTKSFELLGTHLPDSIAREYIDSVMASMYGAAMGWRPIPIIRNFFQNQFNLYPRLGGKATSEGLRRAMTPEHFQRAMNAGAFTARSGGTLLQDIALSTRATDEIIAKNAFGSLLGNPLAKVLQGASRAVKSLSNRSLRAFSASDMFNRVWAFNSQVSFVEPWLNKLKVGKVTEDVFKAKALEFWGSAEKNRFMEILKSQGEEAALNYIGRQASDAANFIYGIGGQPLMMQSAGGRILGMFGTWPLQMRDMMAMTWKNASWAGRGKLMTRYASVAGATMLMGRSFGVNLWGWITLTVPFSYAGGPAMDYVEDLRDIMNSPPGYKLRAIGNLGKDIGRLLLPGQLVVGNFARMTEETGRGDVSRALGAMFLGRPVWDGNPILQQPTGIRSTFIDPDEEDRSLNNVPPIPPPSLEALLQSQGSLAPGGGERP